MLRFAGLTFDCIHFYSAVAGCKGECINIEGTGYAALISMVITGVGCISFNF